HIVYITTLNPHSFAFGHAYLRTPYWFLENQRAEIITDRPAYRPDDTVYWKLVSRITNDTGIHALPPGTQIEVEFESEEFDSTYTFNVEITDIEGTVSGEFIIPEDVWLGEWTITARVGKKRLGSTDFALEEYRIPDFTA